MLGVFKLPAHRSALISLALSIVIAVSVWRMPLRQAGSATLEGAVYGLFPILWILINAIWVYRLTVITGWFEVLGERIRSISDDQRIQAILIAFCFGALLESLAGFGAPVAISAAMLMAAGMKPIKAAVVSLLANTAPVAFGAMAAPIITLSSVTGIDIHVLSQMAGRQTPFVAMFVPFILVFLVDGRRGVRQTWPIAAVAGLTFGLAQFITSNFIAVEITDIVASVVTVGVVLAVLRVWRPASAVSPNPRNRRRRSPRRLSPGGAPTIARSSTLAATTTLLGAVYLSARWRPIWSSSRCSASASCPSSSRGWPHTARGRSTGPDSTLSMPRENRCPRRRSSSTTLRPPAPFPAVGVDRDGHLPVSRPATRWRATATPWSAGFTSSP